MTHTVTGACILDILQIEGCEEFVCSAFGLAFVQLMYAFKCCRNIRTKSFPVGLCFVVIQWEPRRGNISTTDHPEGRQLHFSLCEFERCHYPGSSPDPHHHPCDSIKYWQHALLSPLADDKPTVRCHLVINSVTKYVTTCYTHKAFNGRHTLRFHLFNQKHVLS